MCIQRSVRTHMPANRFTFILCISPVHIQPSPGGMWPVRVRHSITSRSCYISACGLSLFSLLIFSRLTVFPPSTVSHSHLSPPSLPPRLSGCHLQLSFISPSCLYLPHSSFPSLCFPPPSPLLPLHLYSALFHVCPSVSFVCLVSFPLISLFIFPS